ncbi:hypothetical protein FRB99_006440 [Tulasnella sp. 403]|nr:hypothetical protein FRB99_006440 [Tulasnella sp. 403]
MTSPIQELTQALRDMEGIQIEGDPELHELWNSSSSARQIHDLGQVEIEIANLLQLAASAMKLLALPGPEDVAPPEGEGGAEAAPEAESAVGKLKGGLTPREAAATGEERAELFVDRANHYFDTLDLIQYTLRRALYNLRQKKISPSSILAPPPDFVPSALGVGPSRTAEGKEAERQGLQETRVEKEAWLGIADGLRKLKELQERMKNGDAFGSHTA